MANGCLRSVVEDYHFFAPSFSPANERKLEEFSKIDYKDLFSLISFHYILLIFFMDVFSYKDIHENKLERI